MRTLSKILGIGLITIASLTGCMKSYEFEEKKVKFNKNISASMIIHEGDSIVKYYTPFRGSEGPTGKDVIMTATYKNGKMNLSDYTCPGFNQKIKNYDYCKHKIDSLERKNK